MEPDFIDLIDYMGNLKVVDRCSECGDEIIEGEQYYYIEGLSICLECMKNHKRYAK